MFGLELVVVLLATILVAGVVAGRLRVAAPIVLLVAGASLGFVPALRQGQLPPELVLLVFLPALLFWESLYTSFQGIRRDLRGAVLSSTVLVVATAAAVAWLGHLLGLPWGPAWVLGAAVAPTDSTAVAAMARTLPRTSITDLRAESLVNDGTALVLYGVAVGVTVGDRALSAPGVTWLFTLSFGGGIAAGVVVGHLGGVVRRRVRDAVLGNVVLLLLPFSAFFLADVVGASGVLAVVVCGLVMTHMIGPRVVDAATRQLTISFWTFTTFLINASLFVLIGMEAQTAVRTLRSTSMVRALLGAVAIWGAVLLIRFAFLVLTAHVSRLLDWRPQHGARRDTRPVSVRARAVDTVAGFRGAISLAAAIAVPRTLGDGAPFPARDVIVFTTAVVVALTLVVQGLLLPVVARWARPPQDDAHAEQRRLAVRESTQAALDALPDTAKEMGASNGVVERVRSDVEEYLRIAEAGRGGREDEETITADRHYRRLVLDLLGRMRQTVLQLRNEHRIDDDVLHDVQAQIDVEEVRLSHD